MNTSPNLLLNTQNKLTDCWLEKNPNILLCLDFPTDKVRRTFESDRENNKFYLKEKLSTISWELAKSLRGIAVRENSSLSIILLTAFEILLYRYSNQNDIWIGCLDWELNNGNKLGFLPAIASIEGELSFLELQSNIAEQVSEAEAVAIKAPINADEHKLEETKLKPQMLFRFKKILSEDRIDNTNKIQSELFFDFTETSDSLNLRIEYNSNLFEESTIQRISNNYQVLLQSIAANPNKAIAYLSILSPAEKQQVLYQQDRTQVEFASQPRPIHQLFEERVERNSQAIAIICQGGQLTYDELNNKANQLARHLQSLGVTTGSLVGLCIERSLNMVVGVLGILKAGGAYVPLDISNPPARIAYILEDACVKVLVTQADLLDKLPTQIEQTVCIDRDKQAIANYPSENLAQTVDVADLAHIVYTSGSTGKPKGVMLTHGNLCHYAQSLQQTFNITPNDIYLHRGSIALIVSARQLLMPLAQGATALIVTKAEIRDPLEFFALIKRYGVTIVDHVPSFWRNFWGILNQQTEDFRRDLLDNQVRLVAAGGEQVTPEIYQCWRQIFHPDVKLANIYGQTEGTGVVTVYPIPRDLECSFKSLPVGLPIPNMKVYLLDNQLQPVPIGVTAEIHISGAGVAKGYLNRPELTKEKFISIPNPPAFGTPSRAFPCASRRQLEHSLAPDGGAGSPSGVARLLKGGRGDRLYKTGDLGRYLADGTIQFLGRADRQVNIQGLRIELGEIEAVLSQSELVQEAAVVVRANKLGETLAAFIISSPSQEPTVEMLRNYLATKLPGYMIPNTFVFLDTFPMTTSGKVDRRALTQINIDDSASVVAPRDRTESEILALLRDILGINQIGIQDNFIELGGNSLLAARLVTEIERKYARKISISRVFQAPTAEALANLIRQEAAETYPKTFVPIEQGNSSQPTVYCIHYLGYGLEYYRPLIKHLNLDVSLYGLSVDFTDDRRAPHPRDIVNLAAYYVRDLQQFQPSDPYYLLGVSFGGVVAYEMAQILTSQGQEVKFLGLIDSRCPDGSSYYRTPSQKERLLDHVNNLKTQRLEYIKEKVQRRSQIIKEEVLCNLYDIDWIRQNFLDETGREFAQAKYNKFRKEHHEVNKNYAMQPYSGSIELFRATEDIDPKLDWSNFALGGLTIRDIPGDHLEILQEPNVGELAKQITLALQPFLAG